MAYKVKLDVFEGPFDLLVYLIENAEMNIYDIPVAEITRQYIQYIEDMKRADVAVAGEFMVLAASLIEMKSKMLLPRSSPDDLAGEAEDPRSQLVQKLLEYKKCKAQARFLWECEERAVLRFTKPREDLSVYTKEPDEILNMDLAQFIQAFCAFLEKKQRVEEVERRYAQTQRRRISLETRVEQIKKRMEGTESLRFRDLLEENYGAENVVLTFLSILELVRQKYVDVNQRVNFGEITLTVTGSGGKDEESMQEGAVQ
ncbi:MAG: segregation/condensation protein A [Anaerovoracaceae bacterium]|nr:segregation/condensation protein A [Bacillota bacterium]MDY3954560.1 segregation/condensation protein A [Anaerovoracaceae bacterium]